MTAPTTRLLACAATAAVTLGLLTGCTGGSASADPTPAPVATSAQPSQSTTPSATATASAPQWSATMDEVSMEGATAVGQYFLELYTYVHTTGDTTTWRALSHPDCLFCADVADEAENPPEGGYVNAISVVTGRQGEELDAGSAYALDYSVVIESEGAPEVQQYDVSMVVVRESDRWLVRGVSTTSTSEPGE